MSALMARRTYSLLVTPSALAIFSSPRRNSFGKLIVNVSLICKTFLDIPIGNSTLAFFPELQATCLPLQSAHYRGKAGRQAVQSRPDIRARVSEIRSYHAK